MKLDKYSKDGSVVGQVEVNEKIFNIEINDRLIYELIKAANANLRQGTVCVKERSFIRGGGAKPFRQKGTGRARQGSIRSPLHVGGGTVFGPEPRNFRIELPKRIKREAYKSLFSLKCKQGVIKIVEDINVSDGKTKEIAEIGKALKVGKGVLITDSEDSLLKRAMRNLPWFQYNNVKRISSRDIFYSKSVLITESALNYLNEKLA